MRNKTKLKVEASANVLAGFYKDSTLISLLDGRFAFTLTLVCFQRLTSKALVSHKSQHVFTKPLHLARRTNQSSRLIRKGFICLHHLFITHSSNRHGNWFSENTANPSIIQTMLYYKVAGETHSLTFSNSHSL